MTRAKDISKIVTDADLSGTLDVTGAVTAGGLSVDGVTKIGFTTAPTWDTNSYLWSESGVGLNIDGFNIKLNSGSTRNERMRIANNGDISFYEDTGTTPKLFWDASAERLGIGTSSPIAPLDVSSPTHTDQRLNIIGSTARGAIAIDSINDDNTARKPLAFGAEEFKFYDANNAETLRITSAGNVGIGTSSPNISSVGKALTLNTTSSVILELAKNGSRVANFYSDGTNASLTNNTNNALTFLTNNTEKMRIDSSGNVGIGETAPQGKLHIKGSDSGVTSSLSFADELVIENSTNGGITFNCGASNSATIAFQNSTYSDDGALSYRNSDRAMTFKTAAAERMRILSNGDIAINSTTTSTSALSAAHLRIDTDSGKNSMTVSNQRQNQAAYGVHADNNTGTRYALYIVNGSGGEVGKIFYTSTATSYATTSDHRLKENVTADWDATTRLKQLNPVRFNFIADADTTVDGFLAHEVQSVVPEAISGTHNEVDDDGNPVYQGIDQSKLVPLLVKTIQELEARITALETA